MDDQKTKTSWPIAGILMSVILLGLVAAVAIPGILRARISSNEGAAIGALRTLGTVQEQFKNTTYIDQDNDGFGEFGLLGELSGYTKLRAQGGSSANKLSTAYISGFLPQKIDSIFIKSGYCYQIFVPGPGDNKPITDNKFGHKGLTGVENEKIIDGQEIHYRAYTWPVKHNSSGIRCFAVDQSRDVLAAPNYHNKPQTSYTGFHKVPKFDAAVDALNGGKDSRNFAGLFKASGIACDGQNWTGG